MPLYRFSIFWAFEALGENVKYTRKYDTINQKRSPRRLRTLSFDWSLSQDDSLHIGYISYYNSVVFGTADSEFKSILKNRNSFIKIIFSLKNFTSFAFWTRFIHFVFSLTYFFVDCMYMGVAYKSGSSFPKGDGCNRCTCMDTGDISCDQHSCLPCKLR